MDIINHTMQELSAHLESGEVSSVDATQASLSHIEKNMDMGAWLHVAGEQALEQAKASDARRREIEPMDRRIDEALGIAERLPPIR